MAIQKITSGIIQDGAIAAADIVSVANTAITGNITSSQIAPDQTLNGNVSVTGTLSTPNTFGFKNRIINGGMVIDQRNAGASVTPIDAQFITDRFNIRLTQASKLTAQQNQGAVTLPTGFTNYLGVTSSSAYSVLSTDNFNVVQIIEGYNIADLGFGTASASTVTLSFRVYSSLTGTFGGALTNSALSRSYPFTYSIPAANTWTSISITVAGDTSGTWLTTNGQGLRVWFGLGVGSSTSGTAGSWSSNYYNSATGAVSVVGTSGATFYITGVQLEKGSTATSFDFRDYGRELAMCQRYFQMSFPAGTAPANALGISAWNGLFGPYATSAGQSSWVSFVTTMRANPTVTFYRSSDGATNGQWATYDAGWTSLTITSTSPMTFGFMINGNRTSAFTVKQCLLLNGQFTAESEL